MKGYYNRPDLTQEVIDEKGWFHTGDLGRIDPNGFLYITGRIKNLIVLGGGKKIHPEEVEAVLSRGSTVKETCVVGWMSRSGIKEGTEEVCAVVVPSDALRQQGMDNPKIVEKAIEEEFGQLAKDLAPYKRPSKIFIYLEELPKTATRKVKRTLVQEWLKRQEV